MALLLHALACWHAGGTCCQEELNSRTGQIARVSGRLITSQQQLPDVGRTCVLPVATACDVCAGCLGPEALCGIRCARAGQRRTQHFRITSVDFEVILQLRR